MVSIIILNFNGKEFLADCLNSVLKQSYKEFEIIIVDNASSDGSIEFLNKYFSNNPKIKIIKADNNFGFAGGNNYGLKYATGDYIVLLNNDTIVDSDWLKYLVEVIEREDNIGIVQSLVLTEGIPDKYYEINGTINLLGHNIMEIFRIDENGTGEIFIANGCSLIIKKNIVDKFGELFPDEYFAYSEDTYLSLRVKYLGMRIMHNSKSIVHHKGNATFKKQYSSKLFFYRERNRLLNFLLFFNWLFILKYILYLNYNFCIKFIASFFINSYSLKGLFKAYFWIFLNVKWIIGKRKKLRQDFKVNQDIVLGFIASKMFNGDNFFEKIVNNLSFLYCKIFKIHILENRSSNVKL